METYTVNVEDGALSEVKSDSLQAAFEAAVEWVRETYSFDRKELVWIKVTSIDGVYKAMYVEFGNDPTPPECTEDRQDHEWSNPYHLVGGMEENPGWISVECNRTIQTEVCVHCGCYRKTKSESIGGQMPVEPRRVSYEEPDEASTEWVCQNSH